MTDAATPPTPATVLVTGGAGFIGGAVCRHYLARTACRVVCFDALTYAADRGQVTALTASYPGRYAFIRGDLTDAAAVTAAVRDSEPDGILHLAAETHVDRSIDAPAAFIGSNVVGTFNLLQAARAYYRALPPARREGFRLVQVSTDEVYGTLGPRGRFTPESPYAPRSPYAASKAAADHLARAWHHTYGLPTVITHCSNNYGPYQFPEKLIPLTVIAALAGRALPVYGTGLQVRDWLHVDDHAAALALILARGRPGGEYLIGGRNERTNLEVVTRVCRNLDALRPRADGRAYAAQITHVSDRPGHDARYAVDPTALERELGWRPTHTFDAGLTATVRWYLEHEDWWRALPAAATCRRGQL